MRKAQTWALWAVALAGPMILSGCAPIASAFFPFSMGIFTPIPVPPWVTERMEEKYCWKNDFRTPILPPIPPGTRPLCEDPPDDARVIRAMPPVARGVPYFYEEFRDDITVVKERIKDEIDPPRFFPPVGPAQLHHCHWKCTIFYTETIESGYPFPFRCKRPRVQVVYVDLDHLHAYPCANPETFRSFSRDLSGP
jgi:hypothetical protein